MYIHSVVTFFRVSYTSTVSFLDVLSLRNFEPYRVETILEMNGVLLYTRVRLAFFAHVYHTQVNQCNILHSYMGWYTVYGA